MLAHASGEWISSDWPVCAISDTASPQRMGAALTYARRYALFALVGIAGEDDLDAPDLTTPTSKAPANDMPKANGHAQLKGRRTSHSTHAMARRDTRTLLNSTKEIIGTEASAERRDRLIAEINGLSSSDEAAVWAHRCLVEKSKLHEVDAQQVERSFAAKLATFGPTLPTSPVCLRCAELRGAACRLQRVAERAAVRDYRKTCVATLGTTSASRPRPR